MPETDSTAEQGRKCDYKCENEKTEIPDYLGLSGFAAETLSD